MKKLLIITLVALSSTATYAKDYLVCYLTDIEQSPLKSLEFTADLVQTGTNKTAQLSIPGFLSDESYEVYVTHNDVDAVMTSFSEIKFYKGDSFQRYKTNDVFVEFLWGKKENPNVIGSLKCRSVFATKD